MSSERINQSNNDSSKKDDRGRGSQQQPSPSLPPWRSVQIASPNVSGITRSIQGIASPGLVGNDDVIDKAAFFSAASTKPKPAPVAENQTGSWVPTSLRPVPAFYPLEKSSRFVGDELNVVAGRISESLRVLSVQAIYNNEAATASLMTSESVEMHLSLWKTSGGRYPNGIVIELQRRKGDSMVFHRYSRYILDAAVGDFDAAAHVAEYGADFDLVYSKKVQRVLNMNMDMGGTASEHESAIIAIEIAHGLLMKDRMDARQLGLESLCLLTDPRKTGRITSLIASRVVLLGTAQESGKPNDSLLFDETPFLEIRETILSLIEFRRIGEEDEFDEGHGNDEVELDDELEGRHPAEADHMTLLHNLALAVLANALDVIENQERFEEDPEETDKKPAAAGTESASTIAKRFMDESHDFSKREILSTLIQELDKAEKKPHNASLSAKIVGSLCRASEEAKRRAKELGAKTIVATALDVGERTHLKLETECKKLLTTLQEHTEEGR